MNINEKRICKLNIIQFKRIYKKNASAMKKEIQMAVTRKKEKKEKKELACKTPTKWSAHEPPLTIGRMSRVHVRLCRFDGLYTRVNVTHYPAKS